MELISIVLSRHHILSLLFLSSCAHYRKITLDAINTTHQLINEEQVKEKNVLFSMQLIYLTIAL
jgi:hypothetical protein